MGKRTTEIAVLGGGPAGLQAALTIGRVHRDVIVFDSGEYRNATVEHMHNVAGFDGTPPADFRVQVRSQIAEYSSVTFESTPVREIISVGNAEEPAFEIRTDDDVVTARGVVLATGLRDELPAIDGLQELWGLEAAQCPFCHGHEAAGKSVAILGATAAPHLAVWLHRIAGDLVVLDNGVPATDDVRGALDGFGARLVEGAVTRFQRTSEGVAVEIEGASTPVTVAAVFVVPELHQRSPFAHQLGLALNESGCVRIDAFGHTSVPGVYAAGDMAHLSELPMPQASVIQSVAAGQTAAATAVRERA